MYYTEGLEIPRDTPAGGLTGVGGGGGSGGGGVAGFGKYH